MALRNNLQYATRTLLREPGFTAVALLTLGLAIGANTAIFSVADALLLKPLPLPRADRLVVVMRHFPEFETDSVSVPKFMFLREHSAPIFAHTAAYERLGSGFNLAGEGAPERLRGARVSRDFFTTLGVPPVLGRDFLPEEDRPGARPVVILSHRLWQRRFGADATVLGRQVQLNGVGYTVVGVMPASFAFPTVAELWTPFDFDPASTQLANYFNFVARLRDGVSEAQARAAVGAQRAAYLAAVARDLSPNESFTVRSLQENLYGRVRPAILVLLGAVTAVLLIACVNIANLQLARAAGRQREVAIRSVLGATTGRIVRQLLTESLLLSLAGGVLGLALGALAIGPLMSLSPVRLERLAHVGIDARVLAFTLGLSLLAGVLFGLTPAFAAARANLSAPLKEGGVRTAGSAGGRWVRRILVVAEVALALVLITGASILVHNFRRLLEKDPGFDTDQVVNFKLSMPAGRYGNAAAVERFDTAVTDRLHTLPEVREAGFATSLPLEGGPDLSYAVEGRKGGGDDGDGYYNADYRPVGANFFATLRVPVQRGRTFTAADRLGAPLVAVINRTLENQVFASEDPIGKQIRIGPPSGDEMSDRGARTIVGVVGDVYEDGLDRKVPAVVYLPLAQTPDPLVKMFVSFMPMNLVVRTNAAAPGLAAAVTRQVWAVDPAQPVTDIRTLEAVRSESLGSRRFATVLLALMAALALVLASLGIYGVLSYLVGQRTREIGVRLALGATSRQVLGMIITQGMTAVLVGLALGLAGAFATTRYLASLVTEVHPRDPFTFVLTPLVLALVAIFASAIPARRASRLDPLDALRDE